MRALIQRVNRGSVTVNGNVTGRVGKGMVILLGVSVNDAEKDAVYLAGKCANLRIFDDAEGKMNLSLTDIQGEALVVSQFTLYGDCRKGRRPSYTRAAPPEQAIPLYERFICELRNSGIKTETGIFGAMMDVEILNDGPVTLIAES